MNQDTEGTEFKIKRGLPFPELLDELIKESNKRLEYFHKRKVFRVYVKCLAMGKTELSQKILNKYRHTIETTPQDDLIISFSYYFLTYGRKI
jgi:hypothetical protein